MHDLNTRRSIQRWENEGGKLLSTSSPAVTEQRPSRWPGALCRRKGRSEGRAGTRTIAVAMDLSIECSDGLDYALAYAQKTDACLLVVHVVPPIYGEGLMARGERSSLQERAVDGAKRRLQTLIASHKSGAVPIALEVRRGVPEYEIIKAAAESKAEMIVIARRHRGPLGRMLFGSVSDDLLDASPVPVLVVTPKK